MNLSISFENGLREIFAHKFRSGLSMLGIVLGVSSLVSTLALTAGIEHGSRTFMTQMGGLELVEIINKEISDEMLDFWNLSPGRTLQDAYGIQQSAPYISHVAPELHDGMPVSAGANTFRARATGTWKDYAEVKNVAVAHGRFLADLDEALGKRSVVIGNTIGERLWPTSLPQEWVGKTVFLKGVPFEVVGVLEFYERERDKKRRERGDAAEAEKRRQERGNVQSRSWDPFRGKNEAVLIPFSTMFHEFKSGAFAENAVETVPLNDLSIKVEDLTTFEAALEQVRSVLIQTHRGVDDFGFDTREDWFDQMESSIRSTRISGGLIAAISLIVGGIGIANIMLASISERVREIGIRRAVGAKARDIFLQILIESVSIAVIGGLIGVGTGVLLTQVITFVAPSDNDPLITMTSVVMSVTFAFVAGVVSGLYPAIQAARLDPIQALRYE